ASPLEAFLVALEDASPAAKHLVDARRFDVARRVLRRQLEASQPVALDEPELRLVRGLDSREPKRRARIAEDLVRLPLAPRREEVADRLDAEVETRSRAVVASRPRKEATRMTEEPKQIATGLVRRDESDLREPLVPTVGLGRDDRIEPIEDTSSGLGAQSLREPRRPRRSSQERVEPFG